MEATLLQDYYRMADTRLGYIHVPGHIYRTHHTHSLMKNQNSLQINFFRRINLHIAALLPLVKQYSSPQSVHEL